MDKQLTKEQTEELFKFVKSKYVRYVDLQYELVDHLASAIEDEIEKDKNLSFSAALSKVYSRFPVTGFTNFVAEKQSALTSYWRRRWFRIFKSYFTPPQVFLTFLIFVFCYLVISTFGTRGAVVLLLSSWGLKIMTMILIDLKVRRNNIKVNDFLFFSTGLAFFIGTYSLDYLCFQFFSRVESLFELWYFDLSQVLILSTLLTSSFILTHANFTIFPKMLTEEIQKKYAHLGLNFN
ncbi:MAG: hypothetical protein WBO36_03800 [Saprospiraceae bacterium]